jgi:hypothetical protein
LWPGTLAKLGNVCACTWDFERRFSCARPPARWVKALVIEGSRVIVCMYSLIYGSVR